jgi:hypothetical protein
METMNPEIATGPHLENSTQTEEQNGSSNSQSKNLSQNSPEEGIKSLTKKQLGQLRKMHITVGHGTVRACGHKAKFSKDHDPRNNCVSCWEAYFMTSVDLDFIHSVLTQKGVKALVAMRGTKFVKAFHGFLSSKMLPMLAAEINNTELPAQVVGGTFGNNTAGNEVQADSSAQ